MSDASHYISNIAPAKLELLIAIVRASKLRFYTNLIQSSEANLQLSIVANGTSDKAIMDYLGLNQSNRTAILSVVREDKEKDLLEQLDENFTKLKDGGGIAITVPLTSVIGTLVYGFLSNDKRIVNK